MFLPLLLLLTAALSIAAPSKRGRKIQVQAHRGGAALRPESTLYAYAYALEVGVDVLEMDTLFTKDGVAVIWHDHVISPLKCLGVYVGRKVSELTLAELKTLDCGTLPQLDFPQRRNYPGAKIPTLEEVLELVKCVGDEKVEINLETKLDPTTPNDTFPPEKYIQDLIPILQKHSFHHRTIIQSFDWRTLSGIKSRFPTTRIVALTRILPSTQTPDWQDGRDLADFNNSIVAAAKSVGADVLGPVFGVGASVNALGYVPYTTEEMVKEAHREGMEVVPWTVDDESSVEVMMRYGVDGVISNYPERVICVGRKLGYEVGREGRVVSGECLKKGGAYLGRDGIAGIGWV